MTRYIKIAVLGIVLASCSSEKVNLSPVYESYASTDYTPVNFPDRFSGKTVQNFYASELVNQMSTFPNFRNSAVNSEVGILKQQVREYVFAMQEYNNPGRQKALQRVEDSYKKIQKLRKFLNYDEDQVINRYLVRIKSNISQLEAAKPAATTAKH